MSLDKGLLVGSYVLLDRDRLIARCGAVMAQRGAQLLQIKVQTTRNQRQIRINIAVLLSHQEA